MNLNLYEDHFSYVSDMEKYSHSFLCSKCDRLWKHVGMLHRHERTCTGNVIYKYPGGVYHTQQTVFDRLEDEGIDVPEGDRCYPYRATCDIEVMLQPRQETIREVGVDQSSRTTHCVCMFQRSYLCRDHLLCFGRWYQWDGGVLFELPDRYQRKSFSLTGAKVWNGIWRNSTETRPRLGKAQRKRRKRNSSWNTTFKNSPWLVSIKGNTTWMPWRWNFLLDWWTVTRSSIPWNGTTISCVSRQRSWSFLTSPTTWLLVLVTVSTWKPTSVQNRRGSSHTSGSPRWTNWTSVSCHLTKPSTVPWRMRTSRPKTTSGLLDWTCPTNQQPGNLTNDMTESSIHQPGVTSFTSAFQLYSDKIWKMDCFLHGL